MYLKNPQTKRLDYYETFTRCDFLAALHHLSLTSPKGVDHER